MKKPIRFMDTSFRDGFQSCYGARVKTEDFLPALAAAAEAGIDNFEIGGGARFQSLYFYCQEDAFEMHQKARVVVGPKVNLQTLSRGVNVVGLESYHPEIIKMHADLFAKHCISTVRNFDALNDVRNLQWSGECITRAGMKHQVTVTMMGLPPGVRDRYAHTPAFYADTLKQIIDSGLPFDSVCFKDASGTSTPATVGETIKLARRLLDGAYPSRHVDIEFHSHCTVGVAELCHMAAIEHGADLVDLAMSPLSGGSCHTDILTMWHMLKGTSYVLVDGQGVEIDYEKILLAEEKFKECMEKYFMPPEAQATEPLVCLSPMPGGALTANTQMMRDNKCLHRYPEVIKAMREVVERGGFGTSVTPVSQFYFQQAFANVMQGPWEKITDGYGKMVLGYFGKTPSQPDPEIVRLAAEQLKLPPTTESVVDINRRTKKDKAGFAKIVSDAGLPATDENIFIVAICGDKGLAYLKGDRPLGIRYNQPEPKKDEKKPETPAAAAPAEGPFTVVVNGHAYQVDVAGNTVTVNGHPYQVDWLPAAGGALAAAPAAPAVPAVCINSPMPGSVVRVEVQIGQPVQAGDVIVVLESMKMEIPVKAVAPGVVSVVFVKKGDVVETGQPLAGLGGTPAAAAPMPVAPMHVQTAPATAPAPRAGTIRIAAPMPAAVMRMEVQVGQPVKAGDVIVVLEAMKMEIPVKASVAGTVKAVHVRKGDVVETGQLLVEM
jgi:pyruvate carboxylase subunit B